MEAAYPLANLPGRSGASDLPEPGKYSKVTGGSS
jgi:hypothetical protein